MKKVTFAVCGMGNRGAVYAGQQLNFPDQMLVTAMADPKPERLEAANKYLHIPEEFIFHSADELFAQPKLADIMITSGVVITVGDELKVDVVEAKGEKCERCWKVLSSVGTVAEHPTLCKRCAEVVKKMNIAE